jgi:hypothetical protein
MKHANTWLEDRENNSDPKLTILLLILLHIVLFTVIYFLQLSKSCRFILLQFIFISISRKVILKIES